jgi:hypothetical protein
MMSGVRKFWSQVARLSKYTVLEQNEPKEGVAVMR